MDKVKEAIIAASSFGIKVQSDIVHCNTGAIKPLIVRRKYGKQGYVSQFDDELTFIPWEDIMRILYSQLLIDLPLLVLNKIMTDWGSEEVEGWIEEEEYFDYVDKLLPRAMP